ncbi:MAG: tripartite tricarboxylate transporter substrate binding protein [Betaproteobacteria bacterium]|nr:tripartite tricarboxylate transporter substrate binding protein [Betaproteobacteria bacterium]
MKIEIGPVLVAAALAIAPALAHAQAYPTRTVRVIVPNAAGGPSDLVGRVLAQKLAEAWGQPVVVENRVGAGGNIGVDSVAKAAPDGYTLLVTNSAPIVANQSLYAKMPYDAKKDLAPISLLANTAQLLAVPANSPANSVAELIRLARAEPGKLTYASLGVGTGPHLAGEMFKTQTGVDLLHIPYRSVPQVDAALMVGEVSMYFGAMSLLAHVQAGRVKVLAVTSKTRFGLTPQLPTLAESGLPDYEFITWYGLMAPAGISREIATLLHAVAVKVLAHPDMKAKMSGIGFEVVGSTPDQFASLIESESARWANLIKTSGIPRAN